MTNKLPHFDYSGLTALFERYATSVLLDSGQQEWAQAVRSILREVDFLSQEIIDRNNELTSQRDGSIRTIDQWTIQSSTATAMWLHRRPQPTKQYRLEMRLVVDTKSFYRTAWALIEASKHLPNLNKLESEPVGIVRNRLVDHAHEITLESFQYSDLVGPQIKGPRTDDQAGAPPRDAGFVPNSAAFIRNLKAALQSAVPPKA